MVEARVASSTGGRTGSTEAEGSQVRPATWIRVGDFLRVALQVGLVLGLALLYRVELERGFGVVAALIFIGFLVHAWLPVRWRLPFFLLLTITAVGILLQADGIWLVVLGLALFGFCHLPVAWSMRVVLVLAAAAILAVLQAGWIETSWAMAVIPILAAMFMFRLILYLYDLKNDKTPADPWQRLAYFFLLPNVCFPLFPVVDFKTFLRTYYDAPAAEIYQKGAYWMLRGVGHLLLYRIVYYLLPHANSDLSGVVGAYASMAMIYALYLRVSGLFHLIIGSLCLFGFNLPLTNNHYFLASSFTDLWRRINIYWKDFVMTVVFYPVFMGLRRWGMTLRLILATGAVFLVTWFLHSYQWFWLQGVFPITGTDIAFWGFLGAALAVNSVWEARRGRRRRLSRPEWSWREALAITARTIGVFSVMAAMWSLWDSGSFAEWGYWLLRVRESDVQDWILYSVLVGGALGVGVSAHWLSARGWGLARMEQLTWRQAPRVVSTTAAAILVAGMPIVRERVAGPFNHIVSMAQATEPNRIDRERQERGYYETLTRATQFGSAADWARRPLDDDDGLFRHSAAVRKTADIRGYEIVPGAEIAFRGSSFRANSMGMRDREYERAKPEGTYRVALLGSSHVMGWGVNNDQTFDNVLEDRLNRELVARGYRRYEILNFAVAGYALPQAHYVAERIVPQFEPDVVMYVVHPDEAARLAKRLRILVIEFDGQLGSEYDYIDRVLQEAEARRGLPPQEFEHRLEPYRQDLLRWTCHRMVAAIRRQGALPVFVFLPLPDEPFGRGELLRLSTVAREAGAMVIMVTDVYDGPEPERIRVSETDNHPNALGHQLIADGLFSALLENAEGLGLFPKAVP